MLRIFLLMTVIGLTAAITRAPADSPAPVPDANPIASTRDKLAQPMGDLRLKELTAERALDQWSRAFGITVKVDWETLSKLGVTKDTPISVHLRDIRGDKALQQILTLLKDKPSPAYAIDQDGSIVVTDHETLLSKYTVTHEYPVQDIVTAIAGNQPAKAIAQVEKYVMDNVSPESWKSNGGDLGEMSYKAGKLVVRQTEENHQQIPEVLADLRKANLPADAPGAK